MRIARISIAVNLAGECDEYTSSELARFVRIARIAMGDWTF
jgi:hypothetical protein